MGLQSSFLAVKELTSAGPSGPSPEEPQDSLTRAKNEAGPLVGGRPTLLVAKIALICRCNSLGMLGGREWCSGHPPYTGLVLPREQLSPTAKSVSAPHLLLITSSGVS